MKRKMMIRCIAALMTTTMIFAIVPMLLETGKVTAATEKNRDNTCLGTTGIASPASPDPSNHWSGSYVYYGVYYYPRNNDYPDKDDNIKFRVLDPLSDEFGNVNGTVFLDSDKCLYNDYFDRDGSPNLDSHFANEWAFSDIKENLNGDKFLNKEGVFTETEKNAISESYSEWHPLIEGGSEYEPGKVDHFSAMNLNDHIALNGEKIFLLDAEELCNCNYGYSMTYRSWTRDKGPSNVNDHYWIRSAYGSSGENGGMVYGGGNEGTLGDSDVTTEWAVSPAMNIDYSYVIFSSLVKGNFNEVGSEYKLTIRDDDLSIGIPAGKKISTDGTKVTVPYEVKGDNAENANRVSVLILDSEYRDDDTKILYYDSLDGTYSANSGQGTFTLPTGLDIYDWGSKFFVYILAEDINGTKETDYASIPVYLDKPVLPKKYTITVNADGNVTAAASVKNGVQGTKVTLTASVKEGYQFKEWQVVSGGVTLADKTKVSTTFTIGTQDVVIKAVSEKKPDPEPTAVPTADPTAAPTDVSLTLDKVTAQIKCGDSDTLKATLSGADDKITWTSSDKKIATVDANGKVTTKQAGTVTITASAAGKNAACVVTVLYKDVTNTKVFWFVPTNYLTAAKVVKGYDKQTKFKPANECTRAQMVTFLWRLAGEPAPKSTTTKFKDIKSKDYFYKPVLWAVEKGITTGVSKTKFKPQGVCTRAQTVTFLWRMAEKPAPKTTKNKFKDVKKTDYFYKATLWASENKILAGYKDGTFKPQDKCLRRQMVTFLYKYDKFINGKG